MNRGLCSPDDFRDNCGFGLIAHLEGKPSFKLLNTAIESLTCMTHRGGIASDGKTGDGCGLLFSMPDAFMRAIAQEVLSVELGKNYAVGMIFLSQDEKLRGIERKALEDSVKSNGVEVLGWRKVAVDESVCGEIALKDIPVIEQIFVQVDDDVEPAAFRTSLYLARKQAKSHIVGDKKESETDHSSFYICSLSPSVIAYKGLIMPAYLRAFYLDLGDPRMETKICVFHQRFSTNTLPRWPLAQPFRYLAHNGEINTITGNRNWSVARTPKMKSPLLPNLKQLAPLVNRTGSDSSSLDNMLELMVCGGMDMLRAVRMLIPPAWQNIHTMDGDLRAFHEYSGMKMEPWDGPAGVVLTDGRYAVCLLDRNGLRPSRYVITKDGFITLASEVGVHPYEPQDVIKKGRVGPGQILAVDTHTGEVLFTEDIDHKLKSQKPYKEWLQKYALRIHTSLEEEGVQTSIPLMELNTYMKMFLLSKEEQESIVRPMALEGKEAVGAMGDDTPMAVLSRKQRSLYEYFRQQFAQVTNPPIDSLRESVVMSLETCLGAEQNLFDETEKVARRVILSSPILSLDKYMQVLALQEEFPEFSAITIDLNYDPQQGGLQKAVTAIADKAEAAVCAGKTLIVLSDKNIAKGKLPVHALLATGAVHHRLIAKGLRCDANIIVETATARDAHHMAALIGFGASAIYPYLSYLLLNKMVVELSDEDTNAKNMYRNYRKAINKGILKILSKMGISTVSSYRGAQLFEAVGLADEVVEQCFTGVTSRIQGASFADIEEDQEILAERAWIARKNVSQGGLLKYVHGEEYHAFNPDVVKTIREAVVTGDYATYKKYSKLVNERPVATLRDLLGLKSSQAISIDEVEPIETIVKRFDSAGMSLGALSPEAHEALAVAMNRLGGRSNSGEGGEDPARYGTEKMSKIKQVASGRFGVTPAYLVNAEVLQIKVAQGAKPGEGGQLPGAKVNKLIARLRYSVPGVTLISPPPHHDIYSIEDLAQLIFDLKQVNPQAKISVKLVSGPGVGTIAAGVAKAYADLITISGYDGGTAASPLTSIRYAGSPWELGLSEAQQALRGNGLRDKVLVQTDGGLKTGLDVIKAALMGAESFGFGTTPMVALGCIYLRICHLNNCATGVATQHQQLREENFHGTVEMVMNFFRFVATETRELMAQLGVRTMDELIGRTDLLEVLEGTTKKHQQLDLTPMLYNDLVPADAPQRCMVERNEPFDKGLLAQQMVKDMIHAIENSSGGIFNYIACNCDRSIGARISGEIAKRYGNTGMESSPITVRFNGTAGQSFGVWNAGGLHMYLEGDANDYVGKGMAGGRLVLFPPQGSEYNSQDASIIGNTCLYGATGGRLYASGRAGERFAVRNSGAIAVVEGTGDHCCEYMTGGVVVSLGATGYNFGAGMTGGFAFVLDIDHSFPEKINSELVEISRVGLEEYSAFRGYLIDLIRQFQKETKSLWAKTIIDDFDHYVRLFWLVKPKIAEAQALLDNVRQRGE